ncbi:MAG: hypothetical protein DMF98_24625, partial [Acidobacteria bacterium]
TLSSSFTLTVDPFAITTDGVLPSAVVGVPYSQTLSAPNCSSPCTWTTSSIFGGLTLNSAGILSGTPTSSGTGSFTFQVTGSNRTVSKVFSLLITSNTAQPLSILNASSLGFTTIGAPVASSLFGFGGTAPYTFTVQSGTLPPGVTLQSPGESLGAFLGPGFYFLAGRAMQVGAYDFTLVVTDAANASVSKAFSWVVTPIAHQYFSLPISGTPLVYNTAYTQPLLAIGGDSNYTWAANGALPPGLTLDSATGVVSGTPTNTGFFSVPIQVTDTGGDTTVSTISFSISSGTAATVNIGLGPSLGTIQQGFTTTFGLSLSGGTPPYTATALTALPPGFALECGDALPSGTPGSSCQLVRVPLATGTFTFTVRADDASGSFGVKTLTLNVAPFTLFSSTSLPDASVGVAYSQIIRTWDNSGAVDWSIASSSTLPAGLTLSTAGVISGTPTQAGVYSFGLSAVDGSGLGIRFTFSLRVSGIAISDPALLTSAATVGVPFTYTFTATGGTPPLTWSATQLPAGLTMSAAGVLSGTITAGGFVAAILVTATDGVTTTTRRFGLVLRTATPGILTFSLLSAALADVTVGQSLAVTLFPSGGVPPYAWALAPESTLPPGLTLLSGASLRSTDTPGGTVLAGVPTTSGQYAFDLILTDAAGTQLRRTFTLTVSAINLLSGMRNPTVGTAYAQRFTAVGGSLPYTFTMTPSSLGFDMLPPGLTFTSDGLLSGTPTGTGSFGFLLRAQDAAGRAYSRTFSFQSTTASGLFVSTGNPTDGSVGVGRSFSLFVAGGSLPPGLTLQSIGSNTFIEGRVAVPGTYSFTVRATDTSNAANFAERLLTFRVAPMQIVPPPVGFLTPNATSRFLPSAQAGTAYSTTINVAGGEPPYSFSVPSTSPMPPGLTLSSAGVLAGTPTSAGSYSIPFVVQDSTGTLLNVIGSQLDVAQAAEVTPLRIGALTTPVSSATVGVPFRLALADIFGGLAPYTWTLAPGSTLPPGLAILPGSNGVSSYLAGVPTMEGFNLFSFVVTDSAGQSITVASFPLAVSALSLTPDWLPNGIVGATYSATLTAAGGTAPYTMQSALSTDLPPGLALSTAGVISGTPTYPGNFVIGVLVTPSTGLAFTRYYNVTIDNASGQAQGVSLSARAIRIDYAIGSTPSAIPVTIDATTGTSPFQLAVEGLSSVTLSANTGTAPGSVNLSLNTASLTAPGTFFGLLGLYAPQSASQLDAVPVIVTVTAPAATIALATPADGVTYAFGQAVIASYTCSGPSGVSSCTGPVASGDSIDTFTLGAHAFTVTASDPFGRTSMATASYTVIDLPRITVTSPTAPIYDFGRVVLAEYSCTNSVTCAGDIANGAAIDTSTPGPRSLTITATDAFGNVTTQVVSYAVSLDACVTPFPGLTAWLPGDGNSLDEIRATQAVWTGTEAYAPGQVAQAFSFSGGSHV